MEQDQVKTGRNRPSTGEDKGSAIKEANVEQASGRSDRSDEADENGPIIKQGLEVVWVLMSPKVYQRTLTMSLGL